MEEKLYLVKEWVDTKNGEKVYRYIVFDNMGDAVEYIEECYNACTVWRIKELAGIA